MGGGGFDWQDRETRDEEERRNHVCLPLDQYPSSRLKEALSLATKREKKEALDKERLIKAQKDNRIKQLKKELEELEKV